MGWVHGLKGFVERVWSGNERDAVEEPPKVGMSDEEEANLELVVSRSAALVLWGSVVCRRRGYNWESSISIAQRAADIIIKDGKPGRRVDSARAGVSGGVVDLVDILGVDVMVVVEKADGRAIHKAVEPDNTIRPADRTMEFLLQEYGAKLPAAYTAMQELAAAFPVENLSSGPAAYKAYERFGPEAKGTMPSRIRTENIVKLRNVVMRESNKKDSEAPERTGFDSTNRSRETGKLPSRGADDRNFQNKRVGNGEKPRGHIHDAAERNSNDTSSARQVNSARELRRPREGSSMAGGTDIKSPNRKTGSLRPESERYGDRSNSATRSGPSRAGGGEVRSEPRDGHKEETSRDKGGENSKGFPSDQKKGFGKDKDEVQAVRGERGVEKADGEDDKNKAIYEEKLQKSAASTGKLRSEQSPQPNKERNPGNESADKGSGNGHGHTKVSKGQDLNEKTQKLASESLSRASGSGIPKETRTSGTRTDTSVPGGQETRAEDLSMSQNFFNTVSKEFRSGTGQEQREKGESSSQVTKEIIEFPEPERIHRTDSELERETINVAVEPVLLLWTCSIGVERGFNWESCLSMARGVSLFYEERRGEYYGLRKASDFKKATRPDEEIITLLGASLKCRRQEKQGQTVYVVIDKAGRELNPRGTEAVIRKGFGPSLGVAYDCMRNCASAWTRAELRSGNSTYKAFLKFKPVTGKGYSRQNLKIEKLVSLRRVHELVSEIKPAVPTEPGKQIHSKTDRQQNPPTDEGKDVDAASELFSGALDMSKVKVVKPADSPMQTDATKKDVAVRDSEEIADEGSLDLSTKRRSTTTNTSTEENEGGPRSDPDRSQLMRKGAGDHLQPSNPGDKSRRVDLSKVSRTSDVKVIPGDGADSRAKATSSSRDLRTALREKNLQDDRGAVDFSKKGQISSTAEVKNDEDGPKVASLKKGQMSSMAEVINDGDGPKVANNSKPTRSSSSAVPSDSIRDRGGKDFDDDRGGLDLTKAKRPAYSSAFQSEKESWDRKGYADDRGGVDLGKRRVITQRGRDGYRDDWSRNSASDGTGYLDLTKSPLSPNSPRRGNDGMGSIDYSKKQPYSPESIRLDARGYHEQKVTEHDYHRGGNEQSIYRRISFPTNREQKATERDDDHGGLDLSKHRQSSFPPNRERKATERDPDHGGTDLSKHSRASFPSDPEVGDASMRRMAETDYEALDLSRPRQFHPGVSTSYERNNWGPTGARTHGGLDLSKQKRGSPVVILRNNREGGVRRMDDGDDQYGGIDTADDRAYGGLDLSRRKRGGPVFVRRNSQEEAERRISGGDDQYGGIDGADDWVHGGLDLSNKKRVSPVVVLRNNREGGERRVGGADDQYGGGDGEDEWTHGGLDLSKKKRGTPVVVLRNDREAVERRSGGDDRYGGIDGADERAHGGLDLSKKKRGSPVVILRNNREGGERRLNDGVGQYGGSNAADDRAHGGLDLSKRKRGGPVFVLRNDREEAERRSSGGDDQYGGIDAGDDRAHGGLDLSKKKRANPPLMLGSSKDEGERRSGDGDGQYGDIDEADDRARGVLDFSRRKGGGPIVILRNSRVDGERRSGGGDDQYSGIERSNSARGDFSGRRASGGDDRRGGYDEDEFGALDFSGTNRWSSTPVARSAREPVGRNRLDEDGSFASADRSKVTRLSPTVPRRSDRDVHDWRGEEEYYDSVAIDLSKRRIDTSGGKRIVDADYRYAGSDERTRGSYEISRGEDRDARWEGENIRLISKEKQEGPVLVLRADRDSRGRETGEDDYGIEDFRSRRFLDPRDEGDHRRGMSRSAADFAYGSPDSVKQRRQDPVSSWKGDEEDWDYRRDYYRGPHLSQARRSRSSDPVRGDIDNRGRYIVEDRYGGLDLSNSVIRSPSKRNRNFNSKGIEENYANTRTYSLKLKRESSSVGHKGEGDDPARKRDQDTKRVSSEPVKNSSLPRDREGGNREATTTSSNGPRASSAGSKLLSHSSVEGLQSQARPARSESQTDRERAKEKIASPHAKSGEKLKPGVKDSKVWQASGSEVLRAESPPTQLEARRQKTVPTSKIAEEPVEGSKVSKLKLPATLDVQKEQSPAVPTGKQVPDQKALERNRPPGSETSQRKAHESSEGVKDKSSGEKIVLAEESAKPQYGMPKENAVGTSKLLKMPAASSKHAEERPSVTTQAPMEKRQKTSPVPKEKTQAPDLALKKKPQPTTQVPVEKPKPTAQVLKEKTQPTVQVPKEKTQPTAQAPKEKTQPTAQVPKEKTQPTAQIPKEKTQQPTHVPKEKTQPTAQIPKEKTQPSAQVPKGNPQQPAQVPKEKTLPTAQAPREKPQASSTVPRETPHPIAQVPKEKTLPTAQAPRKKPQASTNVPREKPQSTAPVPRETRQPIPQSPEKRPQLTAQTAKDKEKPQPTAQVPNEKTRRTGQVPEETHQRTAQAPKEKAQPTAQAARATAPVSREKPQPTAPVSREKPQPTAPVSREKPQPTAPAPGEKSQPTAPLAREMPQAVTPSPREKPQAAAPVPKEKPQVAVPVPRERPQATAPVLGEKLQTTSRVPSEKPERTPQVPKENPQANSQNSKERSLASAQVSRETPSSNAKKSITGVTPLGRPDLLKEKSTASDGETKDTKRSPGERAGPPDPPVATKDSLEVNSNRDRQDALHKQLMNNNEQLGRLQTKSSGIKGPMGPKNGGRASDNMDEKRESVSSTMDNKSDDAEKREKAQSLGRVAEKEVSMHRKDEEAINQHDSDLLESGVKSEKEQRISAKPLRKILPKPPTGWEQGRKLENDHPKETSHVADGAKNVATLTASETEGRRELELRATLQPGNLESVGNSMEEYVAGKRELPREQRESSLTPIQKTGNDSKKPAVHVKVADAVPGDSLPHQTPPRGNIEGMNMDVQEDLFGYEEQGAAKVATRRDRVKGVNQDLRRRLEGPEAGADVLGTGKESESTPSSTTNGPSINGRGRIETDSLLGGSSAQERGVKRANSDGAQGPAIKRVKFSNQVQGPHETTRRVAGTSKRSGKISVEVFSEPVTRRRRGRDNEGDDRDSRQGKDDSNVQLVITEPKGESPDYATLLRMNVAAGRHGVLTLWACAVARSRGFDWASCLSLAAGVLAFYQKPKEDDQPVVRTSKTETKEYGQIELIQATMKVARSRHESGYSFRAIDRTGNEIPPEISARLLHESFGSDLEAIYGAMRNLTDVMPKEELKKGVSSYKAFVKFRPDVGSGGVLPSRIKTEELINLRESYVKTSLELKKAKEIGGQVYQLFEMAKQSALQGAPPSLDFNEQAQAQSNAQNMYNLALSFMPPNGPSPAMPLPMIPGMIPSFLVPPNAQYGMNPWGVLGSSGAHEAILEPPLIQLRDAEINELKIRSTRKNAMILWAATTAKLRGYDWASSLSMALACAFWHGERLTKKLGVVVPVEEEYFQDTDKVTAIELMETKVKVQKFFTEDGVSYRALDTRRGFITPNVAHAELTKAYGDNLPILYAAFTRLAKSMSPADIISSEENLRVYKVLRPRAVTQGTKESPYLNLHRIPILCMHYAKRKQEQVYYSREDVPSWTTVGL